MKRQEAIRVLTGRLRSSRVRHSAGFDSGQMQITMGFNAVYALPWVQNYAGKADISTLFSAF